MAPGLKQMYQQHLGWRITRWRNNRKIAALTRSVEQAIPRGESGPRDANARPVIFFNASTRIQGVSLNAAFSLLASRALRLAGVPVVHFACRAGMDLCVLGTQRDEPQAAPPCQACLAQSRPVYAGTTVHWLDALPPDAGLEEQLQQITRRGADLAAGLAGFVYQGIPLGQLVLPGLRWVLRRHHLEEDPAAPVLFARYIRSAWNVARGFQSLLEKTNPRAVVVFNGMFFPEAVARHLALQRGLRVITHEVGLQPFSAYFTTGEATAYPIAIPDTFELSPEQNARLDAYLSQRFQGNFSMAGIRFWPAMNGLDEGFLKRMADFQQVVPVFTNVIFDTSQPHSNVLFAHMFAWLDLVLEIIRAHPETLFVIRAHPDEARPGKESRESVADWVRERRVLDLPNVIFIDSREMFSSYELIRRAHFVMVYNSTIGLEASLLGAPVLCGGKARFTQLPTVFFPPSAEAYRQQALDFLASESIAVPPAYARNARRFLYYQLFRTSLPFGDLLAEDGIWKGFVCLKPAGFAALQPENNPTMRTILDGILRDGDFLLPETGAGG
jgi:hypothetical protein